ncbi:hypothetical protein BH20CHL6_BH20CHL6_19520 [soil metagenome]
MSRPDKTKIVWTRALLSLVSVLLLVACEGAAPSTRPPDPPRGGPSAIAAANALAALKLPVSGPQVVTTACDLRGCVQRVTTGGVAIIRFATLDAAEADAGYLGVDGYQAGLLVLDYTAALTPMDVRSQTEAAFDTFVSGHGG